MLISFRFGTNSVEKRVCLNLRRAAIFRDRINHRNFGTAMNGDRRSHGLWEASAPPAPVTSALAGAVRADVAIVGAGYTGCSAALHLALGGASALVLDAAEIGFGGAGRNVGLVNAGLWVMPDTVPALLGEERGERLIAQLGAAPGLVFDLIARHDIACEAVRAGTLHCGVGRQGAAELAERARQWQRRGVAVELHEGAAAARLTGSAAYPAVLRDPRAGTIQPLAYARGLAAAAIRHGARIHTRSPAVACEDLGQEWRITTPGGTVTAPLGDRRDRCLFERAVGGAQARAGAAALFQPRDRATVAAHAGNDPARAARGRGTRNRSSRRSGSTRAAGWCSAASARCAVAARTSTSPGGAASSRGCSRSSPASTSSMAGTARSA
jgi:hypothetical protein